MARITILWLVLALQPLSRISPASALNKLHGDLEVGVLIHFGQNTFPDRECGDRPARRSSTAATRANGG
jgi:hypothetical protein